MSEIPAIRPSSSCTSNEARSAILQKIADLTAENKLLRLQLSERDDRIRSLEARQTPRNFSMVVEEALSQARQTPRKFSMVVEEAPLMRPQRLSKENFATEPAKNWSSSNDLEHTQALSKLEKQLKDAGVTLPRRIDLAARIASAAPIEKCVEDLHAEINSKACQLVFRQSALVRLVEYVQVNIYVTIHGEERRLVEKEEVNVHTGMQRSLMLPVMEMIRTDEDWSTAAIRALHRKVGLSPAKQKQCLIIDAGSHQTSLKTEVETDYYPMLQSEVRTHSVVANISPEVMNTDLLNSIGLPNGSDFVTMDKRENGTHDLHVFMWKSCEDERNTRIEAFREYLASHGVDTSLFGTGSMKSLYQFYTEVRETQESSLKEVTCTSPDATSNATYNSTCSELLRTMSLVELRVIARTPYRTLSLMSNEQYLDDGRRRKVSQMLVHKLRDGETWQSAWKLAIADRLGFRKDLVETCFEVEEGSEEFKETVRWSAGYPLRTLYKVWTVTVKVPDPDHPALEDFGLPNGHSFVSRQGTIGTNKRGRLHVWTWEVIQDDMGLGQQTATAFEDLCTSLREAESLAAQTSREASVLSLGLDAPLNRILDALQKTLSKMVHIDTAFGEVDLKALSASVGAQANTTGLMEFVSSTFTQNSRQPRKRRNSVRRDREAPRTISMDNLPYISSGGDVRDLGEGRFGLLADMRSVMNDWDADFFELQLKCQGALQTYGEVHLGPLCQNAFHVGQHVACAFLSRVASDYYHNPYHNALHAAQVCHLMNWLLRSFGLKLKGLEKAGNIIAALCHDMKHFGRNNAFVISSSHPLALLYNDQAVLENMHAAACYAALQEGENGETLLMNLPHDDKVSLRTQIIKLILSTDMSEHFQAISKFRVKRSAEGVCAEKWEDRNFLAQMCIKAADIGHSALPWDAHVKWSERVAQEFYAQGDVEREMGLPVSALCDRNSTGDFGKSQKGFLEFVCLPLFEELALVTLPEVGSDAKAKTKLQVLEERASHESRKSWKSVASSACNPVRTSCIANLTMNAATWIEDEQTVASLSQRLRDGEAHDG